METTLGFCLCLIFVFFIHVRRKATQLFWKIKWKPSSLRAVLTTPSHTMLTLRHQSSWNPKIFPTFQGCTLFQHAHIPTVNPLTLPRTSTLWRHRVPSGPFYHSTVMRKTWHVCNLPHM